MIDLAYSLIWLFILELFQFLFLPFTLWWGEKLFLKGLLLSKLIGLLAVSFLVWFFGSLRLMPFTQPAIWSLIYFCGIFNLFFLNKNSGLSISKNLLKKIVLTEMLFVLPFGFWVILRGFNPNIDNFEKFMDFGFLNAILKSQFFPPRDMWFSGETINYYYFGHLVGAVLTSLSRVPSTVGYNLYMATVVALSSSAAFTLGASLMQFFAKKRRVLIVAGILTTLLVNFAGTLYTFTFLFQRNLEPFWFWRSIRLIPNAIQEFPQYSFAVSDLHAHMLNVSFVLLAMSSLVNLSFTLFKQKIDSQKTYWLLLIHGWILGICFMTSAWDLPIYLGLTGLVLFYIKLQQTKKILLSVFESLQLFAIILFAIVVTIFLFWIRFDFSISQGIHLVYSRTNPLYYFILWLPAIVTVVFAGLFWLFKWRFEKNIQLALGLIAILTGWGLFLTLVPEVIYIKDIYGGDFYRGNTILKFYYQAFIVLGVVSGVFLTKLLFTNASIKIRLFLVIPVVFWSASLLYPMQILPAYYNNFQAWIGLDGSYFMQKYYPSDFEAITWINANLPNDSIVLEAAGDSYTYHNRVSTFTGLSTIQGWFVHEWLWRGGAEKPGQRADEVREIYESERLDRKKELLQKYNVNYIYIGGVEWERYPRLTIDLLGQLGETTYENAQVKIVKFNNK